MSSTERTPAADGERQEHPRRCARHHVEQRAARFVARGDVEEGQLVRAHAVVERGLLHGIAGVAELDEIHALDDAAVLHVQAGNDTQLQHNAYRDFARAGLQGLMSGPASASAGVRRPS